MRHVIKASTLLALFTGLTLASPASADIQVFWKTDFCPDFGGVKPPIGVEVGIMEATIDPTGFSGGTGGPFCVLFSTPRVTVPFPAKAFFVANATVDHFTGDLLDIGMPLDPWACVVCQYEDKFMGVPEIGLGTGILVGGLLLGALSELRRRQSA